MLGGLARWLRLLGYETDYRLNVDDSLLLQLSEPANTILLTRDEELYKRAENRKIPAVLVVGEREDVRLAQLAKVLRVSLDIDMASTKCTKCGSPLREISKEEASSSVPSTSMKLYEQFWRCTKVDCAKTYWVGSHWKKIRETLERARNLALQE